MENAINLLFKKFDELEKNGERISGNIILTEKEIIYEPNTNNYFSVPLDKDKRSIKDILYIIDQKVIERGYSDITPCTRNLELKYSMVWTGVTNNKTFYKIELFSNVYEERHWLYTLCLVELYKDKKNIDQNIAREIDEFSTYMEKREYSLEDGLALLKKAESKTR